MHLTNSGKIQLTVDVTLAACQKGIDKANFFEKADEGRRFFILFLISSKTDQARSSLYCSSSENLDTPLLSYALNIILIYFVI